MTYDFRAEQIQTKQIIASGTLVDGSGAKIVIYPIEAQGSPPNEGVIDTTKFNTTVLYGRDIFLYVSGGIGEKNSNNRSISVFGGDLHVSGNLYANGGNIVSTAIPADVSASYIVLSATSSLANERSIAAGPGIAITDYGAGNSLAISASLLAGTNITINQVGNAYAISSSAVGSTAGTFIEGTPSPRLRTTASVAIGSGTSFAQDIGSDVFFYVSGTITGSTSVNKAVFGGDVVISGAVNLRNGMTLSGAVRYNIPSSITTAYTASQNDYIIPVSNSSGPVTVVLNSSVVTSGRSFVIKDIAGTAAINNITISSSYGKIDGTNTYTIAVNRQSVTLVCFDINASDNTWCMI